MDPFLLRIDWYSFLVGTQISSAVEVLTASIYHGLPVRFRRAYLYPSVHDNTVFLFRISEQSNWWNIAPTLYCRLVEKYLIGGFLCVLMRKHFQENVFLSGCTLGMYSFLNATYLGNRDIRRAAVYGMASGALSMFFFKFKDVMLNSELLQSSDLDILVSLDVISFSVGATTGYLVGLYSGSLTDHLNSIEFPNPDEIDSTLDAVVKSMELLGNVVLSLFVFYCRVEERLLVSRMVFCFCEALVKWITGLENAIITTPLCGTLLGAYFGICSGTGRVSKLSKIACVIACVSRVAWSIAASRGDIRNFARPLHLLV